MKILAMPEQKAELKVRDLVIDESVENFKLK